MWFARNRGKGLVPRLLLDTHILVRWMTDAKKLSLEQARTLEAATRNGEPFAISAITLLEIAILAGDGRLGLGIPLQEFLDVLQASPTILTLALNHEIALEVSYLRALRDPADRAIVATARVHRLRLVTSDQRIVDSKLVPVID